MYTLSIMIQHTMMIRPIELNEKSYIINYNITIMEQIIIENGQVSVNRPKGTTCLPLTQVLSVINWDYKYRQSGSMPTVTPAMQLGLDEQTFIHLLHKLETENYLAKSQQSQQSYPDFIEEQTVIKGRPDTNNLLFDRRFQFQTQSTLPVPLDHSCWSTCFSSATGLESPHQPPSQYNHQISQQQFSQQLPKQQYQPQCQQHLPTLDPSTHLFNRIFDLGGTNHPISEVERGGQNTRDGIKNEYQQRSVAQKLYQK